MRTLMETISLKEFGARMKEIRQLLNLSQKEVAERTGESAVSITRIEHGTAVRSTVLLRYILFYAQYVSIDVMLDTRIWNECRTDKDLILRKPHMNSVVTEKMSTMRARTERQAAEAKHRICQELNKLENMMKRSIDSVIALTEERQ